jgi:hypothetical protein
MQSLVFLCLSSHYRSDLLSRYEPVPPMSSEVNMMLRFSTKPELSFPFFLYRNCNYFWLVFCSPELNAFNI